MEDIQKQLFDLVQFGYDNKEELLHKLLNTPSDMSDDADINFIALSGSKVLIKVTVLPNTGEMDYFIPTEEYLDWVCDGSNAVDSLPTILIKEVYFNKDKFFEASCMDYPDLYDYGYTCEEAYNLMVDSIQTTKEILLEES